jgi:hypothetical protein
MTGNCALHRDRLRGRLTLWKAESTSIANRHARAANANTRAAPVLEAVCTLCSGVHGALPLASVDKRDSHVHSIRANHVVRDRNNGDDLPQNRSRAQKAKR